MSSSERIYVWLLFCCSILTVSALATPAYAASVTVTATVGTTTVDIEANAGYVVDTHCDSNGNCTNHSGGCVSATYAPRVCSSTGDSGTTSGSRELATLAEGTHTINARATDSHESVTGSTTFDVDNEPTVSLTSPAGTVRGGPTDITGTVSFTPRINPDAYHGKVNVYYRIEGGVWGYAGGINIYKSSDTFSFPFNSQSRRSGDYEFRALATAANGQTMESVKGVTIDNTPIPTITSPSGTVRGGPVDIAGTVDFPPVAGNNVYLGKVNVYFRAVGGVWGYAGGKNIYSGDTSFSFPFNSQSRSSGDYEFRLLATSASGDTGEDIQNVTIDNAPKPTLTSPSGTVRGGPVDIAGTVDFPPVAGNNAYLGKVNVYFRAVGGAWGYAGGKNIYSGDTSFSFPFNSQSRSSGDYEFRLLATSASGDTGEDIQNVTIDNAPKPTLTSPSGTVRGGPVDIAGTVDFPPVAGNNAYLGKVNVYFRVVGGVWGYAGGKNIYTGDTSFSFPFNSQSRSSGEYEFRLLATSASGDTGEDIQNVTIDNAPKVSLTSPSGTVRGGPTDVTGTVDFVPVGGPGSTLGEVVVNFHSTTNSRSGLIGRKTIKQGESNSFTFPWATIGLPSGSYVITAVATATNGEKSEPSTKNVTIDNAPHPTLSSPSGKVQGGPTDVTGSVDFPPNNDVPGAYLGIVEVSYSSNIAGVGGHIGSKEIYQGDSSSFSFPLASQNLPSGDYLFTAVATAYNEESDSDTKNVSIDNAPSVSLIVIPSTPRECEPINGSVSVNSPQNVTGTVQVSPVGSADFPGGGGTYSFADLGAPNGIGTVGLGGQTLNFVATATSVGGSDTVTSTVTVMAAEYSGSISVNPSVINQGAPIKGTLTITGDNLCPISGTATITVEGNSTTVDIDKLGDFPFTLSSAGMAPGKHEVTGAATINGREAPITPGSVTIKPKEEGLGGPDDCEEECGCDDSQTGGTNPVYLANGDKEETETDLSIGSIQITRTYHSQSTHDGRIGYGWTWSYGWRLVNNNTDLLTIRRPDGKLMSFADKVPGDSVEIFHRQNERMYEAVVRTAFGWRYTDKDRTHIDFDFNGSFISATTETGQRTSVTYDIMGHPAIITGPYGRQLMLTVDTAGRLTSVTDPIGRVVSYSYDTEGNLATVTGADGSTRSYFYQDSNDLHNLTEIIDESGLTYARFTYDAQDRAIASSHTSGYGHTISYLANGIVEVTDALGNVNRYTVSDVNNIPVVTSVQELSCNCGSSTSFVFDPATGHLASSSDKNGVVTAYTYDGLGNMLTKTEAAGTQYETTLTRIYNASGHLISETDALGATTSYIRDAQGRALSKALPTGDTTQWVWNPDNTIATVTAANGGVIAYTYNGFGQTEYVTNPDGSVRMMIYDAAGRLVSVRDEAGAVTGYTYDAKDRLLSVTDALGRSIANSYDIKGNLASIVDQAGLITTFTYDSEDRPLTVTNPNGSIVQTAYDAMGNLVSQQLYDAAGALVTVETMTYDAQGRLVQTTYADGTSSLNTYDVIGRLISSTDQAGKVTQYTYDPLGRMTSVTNPNSETVAYTYDLLGRQTAVIAANGATTSYVYDALGRKTAEHSPDRGSTTMAYDAMGNMISRTDGNGTATNYTYDIMNRATAVAYPSDPASNVGFTYDVVGRTTSMQDGSGATGYAYDIVGNTLSTSWRPVGATAVMSVSYTYDGAGRISSAVYPSGRVITYAYGPDGAVASMNTSGGSGGVSLVSNVTRNAQGAIASRTFGNGIVETRSYDALGRVAGVAAGSALSRSLAWNADSMIGSISDNLNAGKSQSFVYDPAERLVSASGGYGALGYTYDANGNRTSKSGSVATDSYYYEANSNRLTEAGVGRTFSRDNAGNRLGDDIYTYSYNGGARLAQVTDGQGDQIARYTYNGRGERVGKEAVKFVEIKKSGPPKKPKKKKLKKIKESVWYVYNPAGQLIAEVDVASEKVLREYVYLDGEPVALAITAAGDKDKQTGGKGLAGVYFIHNDHLGTPQVVTDMTGAPVWRADYLPFGEVALDATNRITSNLRFPGQYFDEETGLHYNYFRDYDPTLGRYIESDPIGLNGGFNTFAYVDGNPVIYSDPPGTGPICLGLCTVIGVMDTLLSLKSVGDWATEANKILDQLNHAEEFCRDRDCTAEQEFVLEQMKRELRLALAHATLEESKEQMRSIYIRAIAYTFLCGALGVAPIP